MKTKEKYAYNSYICMLPLRIQNAVKRQLIKALKGQTKDYKEFNQLLMTALDGRLSDLEDLIDVKKILEKM